MAKPKVTEPTVNLEIDPAYGAIDFMDTPLCRDVFRDKYAWKGETFQEMCNRVSTAIMLKDSEEHFHNCQKAMLNQLWMPAGRILAGAGTPKRVTLLNCFVNSTIEDNMESIVDGLGNIMLTQQQGGGIGTDFSPIRPNGAILKRTGSTASGPADFIDVWDSACATIRSAGDRRGAMMGTLICTHPFLLGFIKTKHTKGKWTNFNVSVLITEAFMGAVEEDEEWYLYHECEPAYERDPEIVALDFEDDDTGIMQYVYSVHQARDLWDTLIQSTYAYAEPGVIFIDRVNDLNNLQYCEHIQCTNPCGEQPLPPHGCCDLGAVNLSRMVKNPFTEEAEFNWDLLTQVVHIGVRFLDNVIDVTNYPLPQQRAEEMAKRRIGLGVSGLADCMHQLGMRYGGVPSVRFTEQVMAQIANAAYTASAWLAEEKGCFPLYDADKFLERPFPQSLEPKVQKLLQEVGIRNGVLLTIAPTGTTSIAYGNNSSGLEPVFAHSMRRKVRQANGDDNWLEYSEVAYGARLWLALNPGKSLDDLPAYMNECADVRIHEHVRIQEVCQRWVDASISKTINVPEDIDYETFKDVYHQAYESGCKGCTTYRPSDVRGSILSTPEDGNISDAPEEAPTLVGKASTIHRDEIIDARTIKVHWPQLASALYVTIGYVDSKPYEVFLNSKDQKSLEWTMALTILMSKSLRMGIPLEEICDEFQQISALEGGWAPNSEGKGQYWPSLIAYLGYKIRQLDAPTYPKILPPTEEVVEWARGVFAGHDSPQGEKVQDVKVEPKMSQCPKCREYAVTSLVGCLTCTSCGWSKC